MDFCHPKKTSVSGPVYTWNIYVLKVIFSSLFILNFFVYLCRTKKCRNTHTASLGGESVHFNNIIKYEYNAWLKILPILVLFSLFTVSSQLFTIITRSVFANDQIETKWDEHKTVKTAPLLLCFLRHYLIVSNAYTE